MLYPYYIKLEKVVIVRFVRHMQLKDHTTSRQSFWAALGHFVLCDVLAYKLLFSSFR